MQAHGISGELPGVLKPVAKGKHSLESVTDLRYPTKFDHPYGSC